MNPTTLLLFLLLSALPPSFSDSSDDQRVAKCVPGNCGTITNIIYPFWVSDQQSPYCGLPEFKLYCDGDTLSFQTSNIKYYVHNIFYVNHSILVVPEFDRGLQNSDCPLYQNMAFNLTPFTASLTNMYLFMIYNCTVPQQPFYYKFPCTEYNLSTFLGSNPSELEQFEWFKKCKVVEIPVLGFLGAKASDYNRLVKDGFLLEWSVADCSYCSASGGQCGYNVDRDTFMCICNDRTHSRQCNDGTTPYKHSIKTIVWMTVLSVSISCISIGSFLCWRRHKGREKRSQEQSILLLGAEIARSLQETNKSTPEFTLFDFPRIVQATDSFSTVNKLGQGGFGAVYKILY